VEVSQRKPYPLFLCPNFGTGLRTISLLNLLSLLLHLQQSENKETIEGLGSQALNVQKFCLLVLLISKFITVAIAHVSGIETTNKTSTKSSRALRTRQVHAQKRQLITLQSSFRNICQTKTTLPSERFRGFDS
jgi:hypothetical protein